MEHECGFKILINNLDTVLLAKNRGKSCHKQSWTGQRSEGAAHDRGSSNSIDNGNHNNQAGRDVINHGLTVPEHRNALEKEIAERTNLLDRVHNAEKEVLKKEIDELNRRLADGEQDYQKTLSENAELKTKLQRFSNQFDGEKLQAAKAALDWGDRTFARTLLEELASAARARSQNATQEEAEFEFTLGEIAEQEVRWIDAVDTLAIGVMLYKASAIMVMGGCHHA